MVKNESFLTAKKVLLAGLATVFTGFLFTLEALNKKNEKKLNPKKIVIDKIMFKSSIILI